MAVCAVSSASWGLLPPDTADWTAVHIGWEITGYLVPRPPLVRPRAEATASTHGLSAGFALTCSDCTAAVGATYARVVSVASRLAELVRQVTIFLLTS